jgi:uncharacterized protein YjdB
MKRYFILFMTLACLLLLPTAVQADEFYKVDVGYQVASNDVWQDFAYGGALAGSEGNSAIESLSIHLVDAPEGASVEYRVFVNGSWSNWVDNFDKVGDGSILGVQIRLQNYPNSVVDYQVYRKGLGWGIWVSNGQTAGLLNADNPITGIRVQVSEIGIQYESRISNQSTIVRQNGETQGTGPLETLKMRLITSDPEMNVLYRAYFQNQGWSAWVKGNELLGSVGSGQYIEAIEAKLEGTNKYHIAIQPYVKGSGWWSWVYDGKTAGTIGNNQPIEAYRVKIEKRAYVAPVVQAAAEEPVFEGIGENPGTSTLTYSAGRLAWDIYYTTQRTAKGYPALTVDGIFDDNPAGIWIQPEDQFTATMIPYTSGEEIPVPDTFSGWGDNVVDNGQFEVYYGSYNSSTKVFTVLSTPYELYAGQLPSNGETHTLILYDNEPEGYSNMILDGFILSGVFYVSRWYVTGNMGSRKLVYIDSQPD